MLKIFIFHLIVFMIIYIILCAIIAMVVAIYKFFIKHEQFTATFWEMFFEKFVGALNPLNWLDIIF